MSGIYKRIGKDGAVSWQAKVRLNGVNQSKTFTKQVDAKAWASSVETTINEGKPVQQRKQLQKTIADVFDDYIESGLASKPKERMLRRLGVEIGKLKIEDLNTKRLALYLELKSEQAIPLEKMGGHRKRLGLAPHGFGKVSPLPTAFGWFGLS